MLPRLRTSTCLVHATLNSILDWGTRNLKFGGTLLSVWGLYGIIVPLSRQLGLVKQIWWNHELGSYFTVGGAPGRLRIAEAFAGMARGEFSDKVSAKTRFWRSQNAVWKNGIMDSVVDRLIYNA